MDTTECDSAIEDKGGEPNLIVPLPRPNSQKLPFAALVLYTVFAQPIESDLLSENWHETSCFFMGVANKERTPGSAELITRIKVIQDFKANPFNRVFFW